MRVMWSSQNDSTQTATDTVQTGDSVSISHYVTLIVLALGIGAATLIVKKKCHKDIAK